MWRLGFFFHEMAFGLLSVFIPLYVVRTLGGSLVELGIMIAVALFFGIPASFFWGYICDKTRRFKAYILLSFFSASIIIYVFTLTTSVVLFIILYVIMQMLHVAHEAPKNVLIAEHYSRQDWEKSYAKYEQFTEIGWFLGLFLGLLASMFALNSHYTLFLCSGLNVAALVLSIFLVADPLLIFERRLVSIEKKLDFTYRGIGAASQVLDGFTSKVKLKGESFLAFGLGLVLFTLASSLLFTPLPIFFSQLFQNLSLPPSLVFVIYMLNSGGSFAGYLFAGRRANSSDAKTQMRRIVFFRSALVFLLVAVVQIAVSTTLLAGLILVGLGFAWAVYYVTTLSLSMELIPPGRTGMFDALVGLGAASGSFLGGYFAQTLSYLPTFLIAGSIFFIAFVILRFLT
jgi:MFS family permease